MKGRRIEISLFDRSSIQAAIREVEAYAERLSGIEKRICEGLAKIGLEEASVRFASAQYDGTNDVSVSVEEDGNRYRVIASGQAVAFIEFGAGVHYNPSNSYPIPKPAGISEIGGYGHGGGAADSWRYVGDPGTNGRVITDDPLSTQPYVITQGNPAQMPMYLALSEMRDAVEDVVKEAFA